LPDERPAGAQAVAGTGEETEAGDALLASPPLPEREAGLLSRMEADLGSGLVEHGNACGGLVVRISPDAWRRAGEVARDKLECNYLSFLSGIDWAPAEGFRGDDQGDASTPPQPADTEFGVAGSAGRFQVLARVASTGRHWGLTLKCDVDEADPRAESWVPVYPGAEWHERECWEMYGIVFDGHPALRHLYLPAGFEGHPLRKDFPLLAREVKPWPGVVGVEPMPDEGAADSEGGGA